ncbi:MAG: hypothetical protein ACE5IJ_06120 [Thermoplasmata archaeon]
MINYFPLVSCIIAAIFMVLLLVQYINRRKIHQLVWTVALSFWFISTLLEFLAAPELVGGNEYMYKVFYVLTAPLVALFGAGSLYLLTHKPWGKYFLIYTIVVSIPLIVLGFTATIDTDKISEGFEIAGGAMPSHVRNFSPALTVPGGIFLIGGAVYSFWLDRTRKYNLLIALGGVFPFIGGSLARAGEVTLFYAFETVGALLLFVGFLLSMEYIKKKEDAAEEDQNTAR